MVIKMEPLSENERERRLLNQSLTAQLLYANLKCLAEKTSGNIIDYSDFRNRFKPRIEESYELYRALLFLSKAFLISFESEVK